MKDLVELERRRSLETEMELAVSEGVPTNLPKKFCMNVLLVVKGHSLMRGVTPAPSAYGVAVSATEEEIWVEVMDNSAGLRRRMHP